MKIYSKKELKAKALEVFEQYPSEDNVFAREDGNIFFSQNLAELDKGKLKVYYFEKNDLIEVNVNAIDVIAETVEAPVARNLEAVDTAKDASKEEYNSEEATNDENTDVDASKEECNSEEATNEENTDVDASKEEYNSEEATNEENTDVDTSKEECNSEEATNEVNTDVDTSKEESKESEVPLMVKTTAKARKIANPKTLKIKK